MQIETERQKYMAEFSKLRGDGSSAYDYVRVIRTSEYGYSIIEGHNYSTDDMPNDWHDQTITCKFPSTVKWIFERCKSICNSCNTGDIITDIPFESE